MNVAPSILSIILHSRLRSLSTPHVLLHRHEYVLQPQSL